MAKFKYSVTDLTNQAKQRAGTLASLGALGGYGAIATGIGSLISGIGAGISGAKEQENQEEMLKLQERGMDLQEKTANWDEFNRQRTAGLEGLSFLANSRNNAMQRRNRSLFANDLMRVLR